MRKRRAALLALVHLAGPASALEPGDLVIGVGTDLHAVEPATGTLRLLSDGLGPGEIPAIAVRADGAVFFRQVAFLAGTKGVWRLDPETGERRELAALDSGGGGLALDRDGSLVVPIADASPAVGAQPELRWLDAETGAVQRALPLPGSLIGISDLALDREGRILISTTRAGVRRVDPATGAVETLHLRGAFAVAVEADGSVLAAPCCGATNPPPILLRIDPDTGAAQALAMGGLLSFVTGIAVEADGAIVVTSEWLLAALAPDLGDSVFPPIAPASVVRVDPEDGAQTLVAGGLADAGAIAPPAVAIEVLPSRIRVGPSGRGILQVVLSASDPVDAESLAFGPAGAAPVRSLAVGRGRRATPSLLLFFRTGETGLAPGDREACLAGAIGVFVFDACDEVVVRGLPHGDQRR